jgi:hypothetical protein
LGGLRFKNSTITLLNWYKIGITGIFSRNMKTKIPDLKSLLELTEDDFYAVCQGNPDVKIEGSATVGLIRVC